MVTTIGIGLAIGFEINLPLMLEGVKSLLQRLTARAAPIQEHSLVVAP